MKSRKSTYAMLLNFLLIAAFVLSGCAPAATPTVALQPTAAPAAVQPVAPTTAPAAAFDIKAVLTKYIGGLPDSFGTIAPAALKDQMAAARLFMIDVRDAKSVADSGYIEGAVNIPVRTLTQNLDKLPARDQPIITYCGTGHLGAIAMMTLQLLGYTNVKSLVGGYTAWKAANLPVVTGTPAAPTAGTKPAVDKDLFAALDKYLTTLPSDSGAIAPAALNAQITSAKPYLVDVRDASAVTSTGMIAGAVNVPIRATFTDFARLPQDKSAAIVTYCGVGHLGAMEMMTLQLLGYTNVKSLVGGFNAWKAANLPVAK